MADKITIENQRLQVPDKPIIPFIEGDGIGPDITRAMRIVIDAAVSKAYAGRRSISWTEIMAGEKAYAETGRWLPQATIDAIGEHVVAVKGPLTTPVGKGFRSLNVHMRRILDLYACIRPVRHVRGVPSPVKHPEKLDVVIFRENTEDVYAGIEWEAYSEEAQRIIEFISCNFGSDLRPDSGIGIKPISRTGTRRIVRRAIRYALNKNLQSVTLVHKGNIMKYTEGAFRNWGYELAAEEFADCTVPESELGQGKTDKLIVKDRIADSMFQQVLLRPDEYDVIVTPNLNGDYLSDACAAQVGGLGMAPGANIGDTAALFEATHGTAPKYAGMDKVNPGSLILSGMMMLEFIQWCEAAELVWKGLEGAVAQKTVTYDLARQMEDAKEVKCSEFAEAVARAM